MAHDLFRPEQAARATIASLRFLSVLPRTVNQSFSGEFVSGRGQTVNVKKPISAGTAKVYTKAQRDAREAIQFNDLTQEYVPVTLEDQVYNAVRLPDDFMTFTIEDAAREVFRPQAESVVDELATPLITEMSAIATDAAIPEVEADGANITDVLIQARKVLNQRGVPQANRYFAVGTGVEAAALSNPLLQKVNESGSAGVLREATIGRLFGFTVVADPKLPEDFAIAYHPDAFTFVTRPSKAPEGAAASGYVAQDGFALRWIRHYNPLQLEDQSVIDCFYGAATLDADLAVSATLAAAGA